MRGCRGGTPLPDSRFIIPKALLLEFFNQNAESILIFKIAVQRTAINKQSSAGTPSP